MDRGWPRVGANFRMFETSVAAQHVLRERDTAGHVGITAAGQSRRSTRRVSAAMTEGHLLGAVDNAFANVVMDTSSASCANSNSQFKVFRDVQAVLSGDFTQPIYSSELARRIGVSVRTMARCGQAISRNEPASLPAPEAALAGAQAPDGGLTECQGLRACLWLLAPKRFLQKLSFTIRRSAFGNARQVKRAIALRPVVSAAGRFDSRRRR